MNARQRESGQALVEWALVIPLYLLLFTAIWCFGQRFAIHQALIVAAREAAFLYSSGRIEKPIVQQMVQASLLKAYPHIAVPVDNIQIMEYPSHAGHFLELDLVTITFKPQYALMRVFEKTMEESCVIKHAPPYFSLLFWEWGPPVPY